MVAGGFRYLLKVRVIDMESYRRFWGDRIAQCERQTTHTYFVMESEVDAHHSPFLNINWLKLPGRAARPNRPDFADILRRRR